MSKNKRIHRLEKQVKKLRRSVKELDETMFNFIVGGNKGEEGETVEPANGDSDNQ